MLFCWGLRLLEQHRQNRLIFWISQLLSVIPFTPAGWARSLSSPWGALKDPGNRTAVRRDGTVEAWNAQAGMSVGSWKQHSGQDSGLRHSEKEVQRQFASSLFSLSCTCLMIIVQHQDLKLSYRGKEKGQMISSLVLLMKKIPIKRFSRKLKNWFFFFIIQFRVCVSVCCQEGCHT